MDRQRLYIAGGAASVAALAVAGVLTWVFWPGDSNDGRQVRPQAAATRDGISVSAQSQAPAAAQPSVAVPAAVASLQGSAGTRAAGTSVPSLSVAPLSRTSVPRGPGVELPTVQTRAAPVLAPTAAAASAAASLLAGGGVVAGTSAPIVSAQSAAPVGAGANALVFTEAGAQTAPAANSSPAELPSGVVVGGDPDPKAE